MIDEPYPSYDLTELHGDLHHLIQPLIGNLRIEQQANPDPQRAHTIDRLFLALALADVAVGQSTISNYDARMGRTRHGCGFFKNEDEATRAKIQTAYSAERNPDCHFCNQAKDWAQHPCICHESRIVL